jgi:hypothetical protein
MFTDNVCLCVSDIPLFMVTNTVAEDAVNIAGEDATSEMLSSLVRRKATMLLNVTDCVAFFRSKKVRRSATTQESASLRA